MKTAVAMLFAVLLLAGVAVPIGCGGGETAPSDSNLTNSTLTNSTFTIVVSGTTGIDFRGNIMVVTSDDQTTSKSVDGTVPAEYSVSGAAISCTFQKKGDSGTLKVEIKKGDEIVNSGEISSAYGAVFVAT